MIWTGKYKRAGRESVGNYQISL